MADNGDGIAVLARSGDAELRVWGAYAQEGSFQREALALIDADKAAGWTITYHRVTANVASWSGTRAGRIAYGRTIALCEEAVGIMRLDYAAIERTRYDGVIKPLVRGFQGSNRG